MLVLGDQQVQQGGQGQQGGCHHPLMPFCQLLWGLFFGVPKRLRGGLQVVLKAQQNLRHRPVFKQP